MLRAIGLSKKKPDGKTSTPCASTGRRNLIGPSLGDVTGHHRSEIPIRNFCDDDRRQSSHSILFESTSSSPDCLSTEHGTTLYNEANTRGCEFVRTYTYISTSVCLCDGALMTDANRAREAQIHGGAAAYFDWPAYAERNKTEADGWTTRDRKVWGTVHAAANGN